MAHREMKVMVDFENQIFPVEQEDQPMFGHCSNNSISVKRWYWDERVAPLLKDHGITPVFICRFTGETLPEGQKEKP